MVASTVGSLSTLSAPQIIPPAAKPEAAAPLFKAEPQSEDAVIDTAKIVKTEKKMTVEEYVRNYFSDIPVMIEIAKCESRFRQYDKGGDVLRGEKNLLDRGVMQINEYFHNEDSEKLGYDILTLEGNTAYARYLFEKYGVKPWVSSSACWGKTVAYSKYKNSLELAMKTE
jgi:hypothetical protein